jgi:hypothetical protein
VELTRGRGGSKTFTATVRYRYNVGGRDYEGDRLSYGFADSAFHTRDGAEELTVACATGRLVDVYYDPRDPNASVLEPGVTFRTWVAEGLLGVAFLGGLYVVIGLWTSSP